MIAVIVFPRVLLSTRSCICGADICLPAQGAFVTKKHECFKGRGAHQQFSCVFLFVFILVWFVFFPLLYRFKYMFSKNVQNQ